MALVKKLTKIGNSYAVILPGDVMKLLNINPDSEVEIAISGNGLLIHPKFKEDQLVMDKFSKFVSQYPDALKKLAQ